MASEKEAAEEWSKETANKFGLWGIEVPDGGEIEWVSEVLTLAFLAGVKWSDEQERP